MRYAFLVASLVLLLMAACTQATPMPTATPAAPLDEPTPVLETGPTISFPQQGPVEGERVPKEAELIGELAVFEGCLRVGSRTDGTGYLLVWPPEFTLKAENGNLQILDGTGQLVARVGEEVRMGGGQTRYVEQLGEYVRRQLPPDCPGPYWIVGEGVRLNLKHTSNLFTLDVLSATERSFFLLRKKPVLDEWAEEGAPLTGKLVLFNRCPRVMADDYPTKYLPLWPPDYGARVENGEVEIVNGSGQVVARVGEEVRLGGGKIPGGWASEKYRQLNYELPAECSGPYWIVGNVVSPAEGTSESAPGLVAGSEIRVLEGEYSVNHLATIYGRMREFVYQVPGISWTSLNEGKNRIEIGMYPRRGARGELEAALATLDIPRGAIVIDVGCEGSSQWRRGPGEPPDEAFLRDIDYSLDVVSQASYGETVKIKLALSNVRNERVTVILGGGPAHDFVVTTPDGEEVWHWMCAKMINDVLSGEALEPGEKLEFTGEWEQVDNGGEPVPPGHYFVRGVLNMGSSEKIVTPTHELEVLR